VDTDGATGGAVNENATAGMLAGITGNTMDKCAWSSAVSSSELNSDGGRFAIDATTGVVTTGTTNINREADGASRSITVRATSADNSMAEKTFTVDDGQVKV